MTLRKSTILYGLAMAALIGILKLAEYRYYVRDLSLELYLGLVAVLFVCLGVWVGRRLTRVKVIEPLTEFTRDEAEMKKLGITKREYEVLGLIADFQDTSHVVSGVVIGEIDCPPVLSGLIQAA